MIQRGDPWKIFGFWAILLLYIGGYFKSPDLRRRSPEHFRRSPEQPGRSPKLLRRSPDFFRGSPELLRRPAETDHSLTDHPLTDHPLTEILRSSPEFPRRSP